MQKVLVCLDHDPQPSVFDAVVAIDAGVDHLLRQGGVRLADVQPLVHGAMFTRGPADIRNTAIFVGGSDVATAEAMVDRVTDCFFGPMRVSVLMDAAGCNTTAAAAAAVAAQHLDLAGATAVVVGAGPVGQRLALLLAGEGAAVRIASRTLAEAEEASARVADKLPHARLAPSGVDQTPLGQTLASAQLAIAAGPAGVQVMDEATRSGADSLRLVIDLNAAPPHGVGGIEIADRGAIRGGQTLYGALGVGGLKMKTHKAAIRQLFATCDAVLDAAEVFAIAKRVG